MSLKLVSNGIPELLKLRDKILVYLSIHDWINIKRINDFNFLYINI